MELDAILDNLSDEEQIELLELLEEEENYRNTHLLLRVFFSRKSKLSGRKNFSRRTLMLMLLVIVVLCVSWLLNIQTRLNLFVKAWDSLMKTSAILSAP